MKHINIKEILGQDKLPPKPQDEWAKIEEKLIQRPFIVGFTVKLILLTSIILVGIFTIKLYNTETQTTTLAQVNNVLEIYDDSDNDIYDSDNYAWVDKIYSTY